MPEATITSSAGTSWAVVPSGISDNMRYLAVNEAGLWVAAGTSGNVLKTSNYGASWASTTFSSGQMWGLAYGEGLFVAAQDAGNDLYSSPDGVTWTARISGASRDHHGITYNDGYFVMGSGTGGGDGYIYGSADGTSWTYGPQGAVGSNSTWTGIYVSGLGTFAGGPSGQYRYNGAVPTSATAWTGVPTGLSGTITDAAWSPVLSTVVSVTTTGIFSATSLSSWTQRVSVTNMYGVAWCTNQFVATGTAGKIYTSPDGINWTARTSGTAANLYGVAEHNGVILVCGDGGVVVKSS